MLALHARTSYRTSKGNSNWNQQGGGFQSGGYNAGQWRDRFTQQASVAQTYSESEETKNMSADDVAAVVSGSDVVVSCLGNVGGLLLMETAANNVLNAAAAEDVPPRCIFLSSIGMGNSSWLIGRILRIIGGKASFEDYQRADARIRAENTVPTVLVRPAALTDKPGTGRYRASDRWKGTFARPIPRADVAKFLLEAAADTRWDRMSGVQLGGKQ